MTTKQLSPLPNIAIFGAGCIGAYLAGALLPCYRQQAQRLTIVARAKQQATFDQYGLTATDYLANRYVTRDNIHVVSNNALDEDTPTVDILLVTVKCTAVQSAIADIAKLVGENTLIIALQNGIGSEVALHQAFANNNVLTGIVGFNVVEQKPGHYHRATEGEVLIQRYNHQGLAQLIACLNQQAIISELVDDISSIRWGKLLLNLNNAINALSDIPLKSQLEQFGYRQLLAGCMSEALMVLKLAGITPTKLTKVPTWLLPKVLTLPDWLFKRVANQMLAIDPSARSSMWYDISQDKLSEIDYINGAIVALANQYQQATPYNQTIVSLIKQAEQTANGSPRLNAEQILQAVDTLK